MFKEVKINKLNNITFRIPSYQRGYRWKTEHVICLLEDLYDFYRKDKDTKKGYCLQPISVKTNDDVVEVVDGQQRLTTIYLILKAFGAEDNELFKLEFDRDNDVNNINDESKLRRDYIKNIETTADIDGCIDQLYMRNTYNVAKKWLEIKKVNKLNENLCQTLTNAFVLWYEVDENNSMSTYEIFSNLNSGKIKLTDSELIKALLIIIYKDEKNKAGEASVVARLWDEIGRTLNNNIFWGFIYQTTEKSKDEKYQTRIDYLFDIYNKMNKQSDNMSGDMSGDELTIEVKNELNNENKSGFRWYEKKLKNIEDAEKIWDGGKVKQGGVRDIFRTFQDWYINIEYYNYVGLAVDFGTDITEILKWYRKDTKTEFLRKLKETVCKVITDKVKDITDEKSVTNYLQDIQYNQNQDKEIIKILKLFNIITCCNEEERFDFTVDGGWSIEHLFPQNPDINSKNKPKEWLSDHIDLLSDKKHADLKKKMTDAENRLADIKEDELAAIYDELLMALGIDKNKIHGLGNLALLGKTDNSSLNNRAFYKKREMIINMLQKKDKDEDKSEIMSKQNIPLATKWAYFKRYSGISDEYSGCDVNFIVWNSNDIKAYFNEITNKIIELINESSKKEA